MVDKSYKSKIVVCITAEDKHESSDDFRHLYNPYDTFISTVRIEAMQHNNFPVNKPMLLSVLHDPSIPDHTLHKKVLMEYYREETISDFMYRCGYNYSIKRLHLKLIHIIEYIKRIIPPDSPISPRNSLIRINNTFIDHVTKHGAKLKSTKEKAEHEYKSLCKKFRYTHLDTQDEWGNIIHTWENLL